MATLLPSYASCARNMTPGERRFAHRLLDKLEDDYLCWYNVPVGPKHRHPDFIILNPRRGLLILEVKDWLLGNIREINRTSVSLLTNQGIKHLPNALEQARNYALVVANLLERDPTLRMSHGARKGKLMVPWGYGVVLTRITRKAFAATDLGEAIDPTMVICQDEMVETVDAETFQQRLWVMLRIALPHPLTLPQIDRIRWHLFPEIRITPSQASLFGEPEEAPTPVALPELIRVMDLEQEQLARSLGEGHRVIHGVSGSGKTMILGYRCSHLAQALAKPILVLCYNVALAAKLRHIAEAQGLGAKVAVRNFHAWCFDQLKLYHVPQPEPGDGFFDRLVDQVIRAVERGQIPSAQYGAVLVDEGHDFKPEWLRLIVQMLDPESNSLLLLYDDAQSIYEKRTRYKFSLASVGIQAQGRTTILRLNYRNTAEILGVAYQFAKDVLTPEEAGDDGIPLVRPETAGRHGPAPELVGLHDLRSEVRYIAGRLYEHHERGRSWNDMAVVYRSHFMGQEIADGLAAAQVPVEWLNKDKARRRFHPDEDSVKVMTMHSSKGLEFPIVAIPGIGFMPHARDDAGEEARLLYVAMTRAMDDLVMTYHRRSEFVTRLIKPHSRLAAWLKRAPSHVLRGDKS